MWQPCKCIYFYYLKPQRKINWMFNVVNMYSSQKQGCVPEMFLWMWIYGFTVRVLCCVGRGGGGGDTNRDAVPGHASKPLPVCGEWLIIYLWLKLCCYQMCFRLVLDHPKHSLPVPQQNTDVKQAPRHNVLLLPVSDCPPEAAAGRSSNLQSQNWLH